MSHEIRKYQWADTDQGGGATGDFVTTDGTTEQDAVLLTERADHVNTPAPGKAEIWLKDEINQRPMLTTDDGLDYDLVRLHPSQSWANASLTVGSSNRGQMRTEDNLRYSGSQLQMYDASANIRMKEGTSPGGFNTYGHWWVKNDTPNVPMFTDDADVDHQLSYGDSAPQSATLTRDGNGAVETVTVTGGATWTISRNPNQSVASLTDTVYLVTVDRDGGGIITGVTATTV